MSALELSVVSEIKIMSLDALVVVELSILFWSFSGVLVAVVGVLDLDLLNLKMVKFHVFTY